jgi:hypothetical protein
MPHAAILPTAGKVALIEVTYDDGDVETDVPARRARLTGQRQKRAPDVGTRVDAAFARGKDLFAALVTEVPRHTCRSTTPQDVCPLSTTQME